MNDKTHVVITYTNFKYWITQEQFEKLRNAELHDEFPVEGGLLKVKNIADIVTKQKYYEAHPNERVIERPSLGQLALEQGLVTEEQALEVDRPLGMNGVMNQAKTERALKSMIRGFKRGMGKNPGVMARDLLSRMESKLKHYENKTRNA